jgi:hypothetical protein
MDADEEYIRKSRLIQYVRERVRERHRYVHRYTEAQTDTRTTTSHDDEDYEILRHPHHPLRIVIIRNFFIPPRSCWSLMQMQQPVS